MFLHYVSVIAVAQFIGARPYRHIVLAAGALIVAYGLTMMNPSPVQYSASAQQTTPILWTFFEILVPLLTFVIAKLRKLPKAAKRKAV